MDHLPASPERTEVLAEPAYLPYAWARSLLRPDDTVLDVGCGNGKVGRYLAASGAVVDGIEPAADRAVVAATRLRHVGTAAVGTDDPGLAPAYDLITFFDVLEHLVDPAAALRWATGRLAPGGRILASVPNSAHWSFRAKVLRGDWGMHEWGLFDRTHLHFYDQRTVGLLRPEGTTEVGRRAATPARWPGPWCAERWPALFALHLTVVWQRH